MNIEMSTAKAPSSNKEGSAVEFGEIIDKTG